MNALQAYVILKPNALPETDCRSSVISEAGDIVNIVIIPVYIHAKIEPVRSRRTAGNLFK
jgi:hypothetical protein